MGGLSSPLGSPRKRAFVLRGNRGSPEGNRASETRPEASLEEPTLSVGQASQRASAVLSGIMIEAQLAGGDSTQAVVFAVTRAIHPTGDQPFAYWIETQDNLDRMAADTVALQAIPSFVKSLGLPLEMRIELARRIVAGTDPLQDQASYIVGEMGRKG